ncbi:MAG: hypothetical protein EOO04_17390 [Chitinophagaceae bacterium]|nr:MAG: hypothetical protein EOO04_17390 [Chitinophagaceae bacterium]
MNFQDFKQSLDTGEFPGSVGLPLQAMWFAGKNQWEDAHNIAQDIHTPDGSWIHAYLHRLEGDTANAGYWYRKAGKSYPTESLTDEWETIVKALI